MIYSGGDDVFIVGAWNDIIELSVDLRRKFEQYTQGTLSISAGIGVYDFSYPIAAIAEETGRMESESKRMPEKNAVTLLQDGEIHLVDDGDEEKRSVMEPIHGKNWKKELFRKNTGHYVIFLKVLTKPEECPSYTV